MDIAAIFLKNNPGTYDQFIKDGTWQQASFYQFSTDSIFWNTASLTIIPKIYADTAPVALLYLLQKEAKALSLWLQQWNEITPGTDEFINAIITGGRFTCTKGKEMLAETFWNQYRATMDGIITAPGFAFSVDGIPTTHSELLKEEEIQTVFVFDNAWQEHNFFIETKKEWILYNWLTAA